MAILITNKDFDLKMTKNLENDIVTKIDRPNMNRFPSVEQSIANILLTGRGERRFQPLFGGDLHTALFELSTNFDSISVPGEINIKESIKIALENFEPRIKVLDVKFGSQSVDRHELNIELKYMIPPVTETLSYSLGIKRVK
tara:strand:- start:856 stop:1281 length:426 start_codon:yes stop_codon:yes gene_type:complete